MTSPHTGFLQLIVNNTHDHCTRGNALKGQKTLNAPVDNFIIMSLSEYICRYDRYLAVISQDQNNTGTTLWRYCDSAYLVVLPSATVTIEWDFKHSCKREPDTLTVHFSFHPKWKLPTKLSNGLYNCSVDDYWMFQQHLDCSMQVECEDGRDETEHCPFSSPACKGWVAIGDKCYVYINEKRFKRSLQTELKQNVNAVKHCASLNASLIQFRSSEDVKIVLSKFRTSMKSRYIHTRIGASFGSLSVPNMYRRSVTDYDKTVFHHSFSGNARFFGEERCFTMGIIYYLADDACSKHSPYFSPTRTGLFCEVTVHNTERRHGEAIHLSEVSFSFSNRKVRFSKCPNGQTVHRFLSCYPHYVCGQAVLHFCTFPNSVNNGVGNFQETGQFVTSVPVFICSNGVTRLSYNLVCDFRHHCKDLSDETFCQHPLCDGFACGNGQCASFGKRCDMLSDCLDDSDEQNCVDYGNFLIRYRETRSPVLINFDGRHSFIVTKMNTSEACPETHYRCPGEFNDCLPVYTRCNGWYDCLHHEDEVACENMTCPGYYRCFNSTVCVHADHLCDGWPHCPQHDDEWFCDVTCPAQCLCQGHVFHCSTPFLAHLFPNLRYLKAQRSGVTPFDLIDNSYIVYLSLSSCSLSSLPAMAFLNLQFLDLSANNLTAVSMTVFTRLANLRTLSLAKNPIDIIYHDPHSTVQLSALRSLDLSHQQTHCI